MARSGYAERFRSCVKDDDEHEIDGRKQHREPMDYAARQDPQVTGIKLDQDVMNMLFEHTDELPEYRPSSRGDTRCDSGRSRGYTSRCDSRRDSSRSGRGYNTGSCVSEVTSYANYKRIPSRRSSDCHVIEPEEIVQMDEKRFESDNSMESGIGKGEGQTKPASPDNESIFVELTPSQYRRARTRTISKDLHSPNSSMARSRTSTPPESREFKKSSGSMDFDTMSTIGTLSSLEENSHCDTHPVMDSESDSSSSDSSHFKHPSAPAMPKPVHCRPRMR